MKIFLYILGIGSIIMLASLMLCGLWIKYSNLEGTELKGAISFHTSLGISAVIVSIVALVLFLFYISK